MAENIKVTEQCKQYWTTVYELLDVAGDYSSAIKLYANLMDSDTAWKVEPILDEYYDGKITTLRRTIEEREEKYYAKVEKLNILCKQHGIMTITKPQTLLELLLSSNRRRSYRDKATRRLNNGVIVPIQSFEKKKK